MIETEVAGETVWLLPERALYWPDGQTLAVADAHLGKAAAFRAAAIPLPGGTTAATLARLDQALDRTGATRLIFLGDLLHAKEGRSSGVLAQVTAWRQGRPGLDIRLVRGNHDRRAGDPPAAWRITPTDEPLPDPPFVWRHFPKPSDAGYTLAGHLHPAVTLTGNGRQAERLACFHFGATVGILPAFGDFTGMARIRPVAGDRVFVVAGDEVVDVMQ